MTGDYLTTFLASILVECGVENPQAVAERAADDLRKVKLVDKRREETVALHVKIDQLRAAGVSAVCIAERLHMSRITVHEIIREQLKARKAG